MTPAVKELPPLCHAVGLMSGTSCDGVDAALVRIEGGAPPSRAALVAFETFPYPEALRRRLLRPSFTAEEACRLDFELGETFAAAAAALQARARERGLSVTFVASHGHTLVHRPPGPGCPGPACTLQVGQPAVIAERTGCPVVSDFRPRDLAAGGQGAPLVPYADWVLFRRPEAVTACLNLGGIANVTVVTPALEGVQAFDTGPANMVIDGAARLLSKGALAMDEDGAAAGRGRVLEDLLGELLEHPYFRRPPPKSTGREEFGPEVFLSAPLASAARRRGVKVEELPFDDVLATVTALSARTVAEALRTFVLSRTALEEIVVSGGGAENPVLLEGIASGLPGLPLVRSGERGLPGEAREAVAFALLGHAALAGFPAGVPSATGARHAAVLGRITPP